MNTINKIIILFQTSILIGGFISVEIYDVTFASVLTNHMVLTVGWFMGFFMAKTNNKTK